MPFSFVRSFFSILASSQLKNSELPIHMIAAMTWIQRTARFSHSVTNAGPIEVNDYEAASASGPLFAHRSGESGVQPCWTDADDTESTTARPAKVACLCR